MQVCIAIMHGKPVMLELRDGIPYIDDEPQPIKQITEEMVRCFKEKLDALPADSTDPGHAAMANAHRAAFLVELLGRAVGDDCVSMLTHMLDHVHYDVVEYLQQGESDNA